MIEQQHQWPVFKRFLVLCLVLALVIISLVSLYRPIMVGLSISFVISYIFRPIVSFICDKLPISRKLLVGILIFLAVTFCTLGAILGVPFIYQELINIVQMIPDAMSFAEEQAKPFLDWMKNSRIFPEETLEAGFRRLNLFQRVVGTSDTIQELFLRTPKVLEVTFNFAMIPLFTYVMLAQTDGFRSLVKKWTPDDLHPLFRVFITRIDQVLRAVVKGQLLVAFTLMIFYMIGFSLIGLPSAIAIGAVAGICRIVPYLDVLVGIVLSSIVVLTQSSGLAVFIGVLMVIAVVQSLDGILITPRIIGERAGLHPIIVISSIFSFGNLFGLLGVLIAVPVVAATVVSLQIAWPYLQNSPFFRYPRI